MKDDIGEVHLDLSGSGYIISASSVRPGSLYRLNSFPTDWTIQYQADSGTSFRSMEVLNDSTLILVGLSQDTIPTIFYSDNYGKTFSSHELPLNIISDMHSCMRSAEEILVSTGFSSTVLRSADKGKHWDTLTHFPNAYTKNLIFSGIDTGYLVLYDLITEKDKILFTADGGENWNNSGFPGFLVSSIFLKPNGEAWVTGQGGEIARLTSLIKGIKPNLTKDEVKVYPNPASGKLHFNSGMEGQKVRIYNAYGQEVQHGFIEHQVLRIDSLPSGTYTLLVAESSSYARFIKR